MALESIMNRQIEDPNLPTEPDSDFAKDIAKFNLYLLYDYARVGLGYFVEDIVKTKAVNKSLTWIIDNTKDSDRAIILATLASLIMNPTAVEVTNDLIKDPKVYDIASKIARICGSNNVLDFSSYVSELATYTSVAAPVFYLQKREEGLSRVEAAWKTVKWGGAAALLSFYIYQPAREKIADHVRYFTGFRESISNVFSQLIATYPFIWVMRGANEGPLKWTDEKEDEWKTKFSNYLKDRRNDKGKNDYASTNSKS